jgi:type I restriction enzyme S subunit
MSEQCVRFVKGEFFLNDSGLTVSPKTSGLSQEFLDAFLLASAPLIFSLGRGTAQKNLDVEAFKKIPIFVPDMDSQKSIVSKLKSLNNELDELENKFLLAEELLSKLVEARLHNSINLAALGIPEVPLGSICTITSSKRIFKSEYVPRGVPFYRTKEIKELSSGLPIKVELFISSSRYEEIREKFGVPQIGDVLLSAVGTIGEVLVIEDSKEFYFKDGNIVWLKNLQGVLSDYLGLFLKSRVKHFNDKAQGSAYSALTIEKLVGFPVPLPNLEKQREILELHEESVAEIELLSKQLEKKRAMIQELKRSVVRQYFLGVES